MIVRKKGNVLVEHGGQVHEGWLPAGAAVPPPVARVVVECDVIITQDSGSFLLECSAIDPEHWMAPYTWDTWHESLDAALAEAASQLGITEQDWDYCGEA